MIRWFIVFIVLLIVIPTLTFLLKDQVKRFLPVPKIQTQQAKPTDAIALVGKEYIYKSDLDEEIGFYPVASQTAVIKTAAMQKLITDSIILQGAQADKIASLSAEIFNSPTKNYTRRVILIEQIKNSFQKNNFQGSVVSIWFNNGKILPASGYENRKKIALSKITPLHEAVRSGKMTMQQAGAAIIADTSLASVDFSYKNNAFREFDSQWDQITFDADFNKVLASLPTGTISNITTIKDRDEVTGKIIDALYIFGQVTKKPTQSMSFNNWLDEKRKVYETTIY